MAIKRNSDKKTRANTSKIKMVAYAKGDGSNNGKTIDFPADFLSLHKTELKMIKFEIPGVGLKQIEHLVLDYNGTLAVDGNMIPGVKEKLNILAASIIVHIVTADTFGKAQDGLKNVCCEYIPTSDENQAKCKQDYVKSLGADSVIAIGNGANDALMLKEAEIGIVMIQNEGASGKTVANADIVCTDINDALELLLHPLRIAATLRI